MKVLKLSEFKMKCGEFSKGRNKYCEEKLVVLKALMKTKDKIITQLLSCIKDLTNALTDKKFKNMQMLIKKSPKLSYTDFHPETRNVKIINSNLVKYLQALKLIK